MPSLEINLEPFIFVSFSEVSGFQIQTVRIHAVSLSLLGADAQFSVLGGSHTVAHGGSPEG
jgi:hypothetical protein